MRMSSTVRDAPGTDSSQATACAARGGWGGWGGWGAASVAEVHAQNMHCSGMQPSRQHAQPAAEAARARGDGDTALDRTHLRGAAAQVEDDANGGAVDALHNLFHLRGHPALRHGPWRRRWGGSSLGASAAGPRSRLRGWTAACGREEWAGNVERRRRRRRQSGTQAAG